MLPLAAVALGPVNLGPETQAAREGWLAEKPSMCASSCVATVRKSILLLVRPPAVRPKYQLVSISNAIEPPQGPLSVLGLARAPGCPREAALSRKVCEPVTSAAPAVVLPRSGRDRDRLPTYTLITLAATPDRPGSKLSAPVPGLRIRADQVLA